MRRVVLPVGAIVVGLLAWWLLTGRPDGPGPAFGAADGVSTGAAPATVEAATETLAPADAEDRARSAVTSASPERGHGALRVVVTALPDRTRLPHVVVTAVALDGRDAFTTRETAVAGETGVAEFERLAAGSWRVTADRGQDAVVVIVSGERSELRFDVPPGVDALVRVLDASGARVPGADVLFWPANGILDIPEREPGTLLGRSDAAGELRVDALTHIAGHGAWFAARHDALGTSDLRMVRSPAEGETAAVRTVELRLGSLTGAYLDARITRVGGEALEGASVGMRPIDAPSSEYVGDVRVLRHVAHAAVTDASGLASLGPLLGGQYLLLVEAPRHVPYREFVAVADAARLVRDIELVPAARVDGTVVTPAGAPIEGVRVVVQVDEHGSDTYSAPDGSFEVDRVPGGSASFTATHAAHERVTGEVALVAGETTVLRIVMPALPRLHGRVVDEREAGLAGWQVRAQADVPGFDRTVTMETAADGTFDTPARRDVAWTLTVVEKGQRLPAPIPPLTGVRPGADPLVIRVPDAARATAFAEGFLVDHEDVPAIAGRFLSLQGETAARAWFGDTFETDPATGRFRIGPLPPGHYTLWIAARTGFEFPVPDVVLRSSETTSLGRIVVPATGTLRVEVELERGLVPGDVLVEIEGSTSSDIVSVDTASWTATSPCLPGRYAVTVYGTGFRSTHADVTVVAGEVVTVRSRLHPAVRTALRFHMPEGERGATFVVRDARGERAFATDLEAGQEFDELWPFLDVGAFEVEVEGASGRRYRFRFTVDSLERREDRVDVRPAPVDR